MPLLPALLALALLGCAAEPADAPALAPADSVVVFVNVTVVPMDAERAVPGQTVVVRGDRIEAVVAADGFDPPAGAVVVDGTGKWLIPGLAEMHGHVPPPSAPAALTEETLFLYLASGITTVRGMLGADGQLALRERANSGALLSPTLYLAGPSFNGQSVSSPEEADAMVRQQVAEGWDYLKVHPGMSRAEYNAMADAAHELGIRFGGHVPADVGVYRAIARGQDSFDHVDGYAEALDAAEGAVSEAALAELVVLTREAGAFIVPTMALWEALYGTLDADTLAAYPELAYVSPATRRSWDARARRAVAQSPPGAEAYIAGRNRVLAALHEAGVPILMGTDAPQLYSVPGFSLHRELPYMEAAGMSPYEILHSGTALVGDYFSSEDRFGRVEEGHRADLVLLDADPLADAAHLAEIAGVMVRGRWVDRAALDARLDAIRAAYAE